jgi:hypothetical protein
VALTLIERKEALKPDIAKIFGDVLTATEIDALVAALVQRRPQPGGDLHDRPALLTGR